ncbi:GNAT family N-acetyltransferase [Nesterenkonia sp. CL21]|uniref:GNAT family N-acetyltransferase n=1 Tax=Nesterenkonia sp. CL21 TaxID=3064894 RepID=UPI002878AE9A|nr:GNAT family N-acetyltransferase [Nesterenkonia sp. CL21]MDS2173339.1 GNAT family N-acetyltransferase [Nesterenkonia sp. CL21]
MDSSIREATLGDHAAVVQIEHRAGLLFVGTPMEDIADDEAVTAEEFAAVVATGAAWVHVCEGIVVGYLLAERLDDAGHVEQVSVDPAWSGRRIGAALLDRASAWAAEQGLDALTLTTFVHVPWNAPYYRRLGFRELSPERWGAELVARVRAEAEHGLGRWPRIVMGRPTSLQP